MVSGHVVEGCPFWPYPRDKFSCPASFPAELFRWAGSLLSPDSDVSGSGSWRFEPAKLPQLPTASFLKDRIQAQVPTSFHSALLPNGADPKPSPLDSQPGRTVFPGYLEKR